MKPNRTIGELLPLFLQSRREHNLRPSSLKNYEIWSRWMDGYWGHRQAGRVRPAEIVKLASLKCGHNAILAQCFFRWCIAERYVRRNFEVGRLPLPPRSDERDVSFLQPEEARRFLAAVKPALRAPFILGLYAGVRPYECCRLEWDAIHLRERRIRIGGRVSKIRRPRIIEGVPPVLWRLLKPHAKPTGRVMPCSTEAKAVYHWMYERNRAANEAGVTLTHDVIRHSFATYYTALTGHSALCAKILGHYKLHTLAAHYDGVATRKQAKEYFTAPAE